MFKKGGIYGALALLVFSVSVIPAGVVNAQSSRDITNRLNRLENELETLNRAVYRGGSGVSSVRGGSSASGLNSTTSVPGARMQADMEVRLQQFERELRDLRGLIERHNHNVRMLSEKLDKKTGDIELRLSDLEGTASPVGPNTISNASEAGVVIDQDRPPQAVTQAPAQSGELVKVPLRAAAPSRSLTGGGDQAAALYENAFSLLKRERYLQAGDEFKTFLNTYPNHVLAGNAQYWLGESHYVRGEFEQAARIFAEGIKTYPQSAKGPDNFLKLALALRSMGSSDDACTALSELMRQYGGTPSPVIRRAEQEIKNMGCAA